MSIPIGAKVFLRICCDSGAPGTVIRYERRRIVVFWPDMGLETRHTPEMLEQVVENKLQQ